MGMKAFYYIGFLFSFCLLSCTSVVVLQTSTTDLDLEVDAYVKTYPDLEIAYDFWSPDGVPFISFFNPTNDTLHLDLRKSQMRLIRDNYSESLEDAILSQAGSASFSDVYPNEVFLFSNKRVQLVLIPQRWASIYGPSCYSPRNIQRGGEMEFSYVYSKDESAKEIRHDFDSAPLTRLRRRDIDSYQRTSAGPDQYYIDKSVNMNPNDAFIFLDIFTAILLSI